MSNLKNDQLDIAEHLIQGNGIDHAIQVASDGILQSQKDADYYALSVWREVNTILKNQTRDPKAGEFQQGG